MRLPIMNPLMLSAASLHSVPQQTADSTELLTDVSATSQYWDELTPYSENSPDYFGLRDTGIPSHLAASSSRYICCKYMPIASLPAKAASDGSNDVHLAKKVANFNSSDAGKFTGFLNTWHHEMEEGVLTGFGASIEFLSGVTFWNRYGRTLYNATVGQLAYNAARPKPVLRTTSQSRIYDSEINWSLEFFVLSVRVEPNPDLVNASTPFNLVILHEGGKDNKSLAAYDSCFDENVGVTGFLGDYDMFKYLPKYLQNATARMQEYAPPGFTFNTSDTYDTQSICAYETNYLGHSDFYPLFTQEEWESFGNTLELSYYYNKSWDNPTNRSQGIGYVQELIARLKHEFVTLSNSPVNSTLDDNAAQFQIR